MVLMLCMGTSAKAVDPIASYDFNGTLKDCTNGYDGSVHDGDPCFSDDYPPSGSGGKSLSLDGASSVEIPIDATLFTGSVPFSIVCWFKTSADSGVIISSCPPGNLADDHPLAVTIDDDGSVGFDYWWYGGGGTETTGLNNDAWHHFALVHDIIGEGTYTIYIDGNVDMAGPADFTPDPPITDPCNNTVLIGDTISDEHIEFGESHWNGLLKDVAIYDVALDVGGVVEAMSSGFPCSGPKNPIAVDPNVMTVYETGETQGDFDVSLNFPPVGQGPGNEGTPYTITVEIDPNGGNGDWGASAAGERDIVLLAGSDPCTTDNTITLTFNTTNWNVPQTVLFKALDDTVAEPPELIEITDIGVTITSTVAEPNLNVDLHGNPWTKNQMAQVMDNDQANILFKYSSVGDNATNKWVTGPVKLWEEPGKWDVQWRKIGVLLQVPPAGGPVKLNAVIEGEVEGDNLPPTDPILPIPETPEPNGLIFTAGNYATPQKIKIWGNDDTVLQIEEAAAPGDENYQATLVVTVIDDGGDTRYTDLERIVTLNIEDNECGAFGISYLDVGNPNAATDPNYRDEDGNPLPDCYVDIYDVIEFATQWLDCSDPQDPACESYR